MVVDDLDHHLRRRDRAQHFLSDRLGPYGVDEILDHRQGDVRFQQRHANLAHRRIDIALAQRPVAAQPVKNVGKAVAQAFEHGLQHRTSQCATLADWPTPKGQKGITASREAGGKLGPTGPYVNSSLPLFRRNNNVALPWMGERGIALSACLAYEKQPKAGSFPPMTSKFTLQALALVGILALSGLPAFAADMTPPTPAPGSATGTSENGDASALPSASHDKKVVKDSKDKKSEQQTAKAAPTASASVSGSTTTSVQHWASHA